MIKLLHSSFLLVFLFTVTSGYSQLEPTHEHVSEESTVYVLSNTQNFQIGSNTISKTKDFSYNIDANQLEYPFLYQNLDHDHEEEIVLIDIISSDKRTDFNCSGGFCMNELHFHKKGLTMNRQLFRYFMSISC